MKRSLVVAIAVALVAVVAIWHPPASAPIPQLSASPTSPNPRHAPGAIAGNAVVYVAGAVRRPGLYHVRNGARADDAVRLAGGFRNDADAERINLAQRVNDGEEFDVPVLGAPTQRPGRQRKGKVPPKGVAPIDPLDVNTATAGDLAAVPGIGKTIAARIVEVRERDGAYQTLDDLLDVAGMTASRLARAERYLHI